MTRRALICLGLLLAAGTFIVSCPGTEDLTEIIVVVDTDLDVPAEINAVHIAVDSRPIDGSTQEETFDFPASGPISLGLVHRGGALGPMEVTVTAEPAGLDLTRTARVYFVQGRVMVLRLDLLSECSGVECPDEQTCAPDVGCRSVEVPPGELTEWTGEIDPYDGGVPDADTDGDADMDADMDADVLDAEPDGDADECIPDPLGETCNGEDDDCDDLVDEDFDLASDPATCGDCLRECTAGEACVSRACESDRVTIAAGLDHSCALDQSGTVRCWGSNADGQLGDGTLELSDELVEVTAFADATHLSAGARHSCAVAGIAGTVWCWGSDDDGQLGDGPAAAAPGPVEVTGLPAAALSVAAGPQHSCAVLTTGEAWCWGDNGSGRLGDGTTDPRDAPVLVATVGFEQIDVGREHSCGVLSSSGHVYCWGGNSDGQLGVSGATRTTPVRVGTLAGALRVAAGDLHTCVLMNNGRAHCWGRNSEGQLGNGDRSVDGAVPRDVRDPDDPDNARGFMSTAVWITAGLEHSCSIVADGRAVCWGNDSSGQLGRDVGSSRSATPVVVQGLYAVVRIAGGGRHSCARDDGQLWCWGANGEGQLGDGSGVDQPAPVMVASP